ncbi:HEPN domain-containing protein [uncultured Aquimarina sp.]|uniref:HEPN domain-containing protein n=1 Tax=uncultured Aquimarina sp. TaxID=575652 RepID=UPI00262FE2F2|nr:HEPN domain-containing protein [uncultured Aquimarina sp.]
MVRVEYLFPFNTEDGVCKDIQSFNSLLSAHSDITVNDNKINYKDSEYDYKVNLDEVPNQEYSVFHVIFSFSRSTTKYRNMLKAVKKVVGVHIKDDIQIIWDGVGYEWSKELYPKIYQVENSLRKLISKFMLVNLGLGWHRKSVPSSIKTTIKNPNFKANHSILYEVDFIQLSHFLFKPYPLKDTNNLPNVIDTLLDKELTESDKKEIENYIPRNNWDRYFSEIVDMESEQLENKWTKLYDIRNKIAHNKSLKLNDYENGKELCDFLLPILENAINSLEKIEIPEEEIETISLNSMANMNEALKPFIENYQYFNNGILETINKNQEVFSSITDTMKPIRSIIENMQMVNPFVDNGLADALSSIENTKSLIFTGETLDYLPNQLTNSNELFADASSKLAENYKGIELSDNISAWLVDKQSNGKKEEDNEE